METRMNWEQMLEALNILTETSLHMRKPMDWYVHATSRWVVGDPRPGLQSGMYGEGVDPATAVISDWRKMTAISFPRYIHTPRGNFIWREYMWVPVNV